VVRLVRGITTAVTTTNTITTDATVTNNTVSAFVVNTANTTIITAATITAAANVITGIILLMASKINDNIKIYWYRCAWLILVCFLILSLGTGSLSV
jgi:hypothetical protein